MSSNIIAQLEPGNIDMLTRLIEAFDHLGIVSTLDRTEGLVVFEEPRIPYRTFWISVITCPSL